MTREKATDKTRLKLVNTVTSLRQQIAALEEAEESLQKERDTLFSILERAPYGVMFLDKDGKTLFINTEFTAITGYTLEDVPSTNDWLRLAFPEKQYRDEISASETWKRDKAQRETDSVFRKMLKRVFVRSFSVVCKDGSVKEIEFRPTVLDNGSTIVMLADITEQKRVEEAFRESEKQFRRLIQYIPDILAVHDSDGTIIDVNQLACESLGYTREELIGFNVQDIEQDFITRKHAEQWQYMVPGVPILLEGVQKRKDGTTFPAEIRLSMFESGGKKIFLAVVRDITERKRSEEAVRTSEKRYRQIVDNADDIIYGTDKKGRFTLINPVAERITGYSEHELLNRHYLDLVSPAYRKDTERFYRLQLIRRRQNTYYEFPIFTRDGTEVWLGQNVQLVIEGERIVGFQAVARNITNRKHAEKALQASEGRYRSLVEYTEDSVYLIDREKRYLFINEKYLSRLSVPRDHIIGKHYGEFHCREDEQEFSGYIEQVMTTGRFVQYEHRSRSDGRYFLRTLSPVQEPDGRIEMVTVIAKDITERKEAEKQLTHMATHDFLTNLPNRILFNDRLTMALVQARRHQQKLCMMLLDLDNFKDVNDKLGHGVGDKVLCIVGERLTRLLRESDTIARMGGDEFLLLLTEIARLNDVITIAQKILGTVREPFVVDNNKLMITTSIGIAIFPDDGNDTDALLKNADIAMYRAKERGRDNYQHYSSAPR